MSNLTTKITIYLLFLQSRCYASPSVTIDQGRLTGIRISTHDGRIVSGFLGIPYAQPPIGNLRFKAPQPAKPWNGTYQADNGTRSCTQLDKGKILGVEDCLYLNVFTPQLREEGSKLLPVMVGIHYGRFRESSADPALLGASYLLDHDVLLVTMNYRLGIFGFLSTGDEVSPGNYALKDMTMALQWIQDNIGAFGGDPSRVTLMGFSSGAVCVQILALSKRTEGLFHRMVLHSSLATAHYGYIDKSVAIERTHRVAKSFDCPTDNSSAIVRCLREVKDTALAAWVMPTRDLIFIPTNEPESDEAIITDSPLNLVNQGKMRDMPWMCGNVRDEADFIMMAEYTNFTRLEKSVLELNDSIKFEIERLGSNDSARYFEAITNYYFNDWTIDPVMVLKNYTTMYSDLFFYYPKMKLLETQVQTGGQAAYIYLFNYQGTFSMAYDMAGIENEVGIWHGDEAIYLFPRANTVFAALRKNMSRTDLKMMKKLTGLWTSFAANGVPRLPHWGDTERWWKYDDRGSYLQIGDNLSVSLSMKTSLHEERMNFWRELFAQRNSGSEDESADTVTAVIAAFIAGYVILCYVYIH